MSINTDTCFKTIARKQSFDAKPIINGKLLHIHHTIVTGYSSKQSIRFLHASFNCTGDQLAVLNHLGNIYVFDFTINKYWLLAHANCSIIKFNNFHNDNYDNLLFAGATTGVVHVFNANTGRLITDLHGHTYPVTDISFSGNNQCVTLSNCETMIWSLDTFTKIQILQLEDGAVLKFIMFIPVYNDIIACFQDETVQIWSGKNYAPVKQIVPRTFPGTFSKLVIRSIAFTSNGKLMIIVGHSSSIYAFNVDTLNLKKEYYLTDMQVTIKKAQFLPNLSDDGVNKILALLSNNGALFFYNMETECVQNKLTSDNEIWKFSIASHKLTSISKSGEVLVHTLDVAAPKAKRQKSVVRPHTKHTANKTNTKCGKKNTNKLINDQVAAILEVGKLKAILKEFGEYPGLYRKIIWTHLLQLPNDESQYEPITRTVYEHSFDQFEKNYPLEVKQDLKNLKRLLGNLVSWCPFLAVVNYLPVFVFPFVKFLHSEPVLCFEVVIAIIANYCQYWFEYHPVPPLNILGIVESVLIQHDFELLEHFNKTGITSKTYAWLLLQSVFSEVLSSNDWLIFCDHLISNEPAFLITAAAAYSITNRSTLLNLQHTDDFEFFFRSINTFDFKRFIARCYKIYNDDSLEHHPHIYLAPYKPFANGGYPVFDQFPKNCLEVCESINELRHEAHALRQEEQSVHTQHEELNKLRELQRTSEEYVRQNELSRMYREKLDEERQNVCAQRERLQNLRRHVQAKEEQIVANVTQTIVKNSKMSNCKPIEFQHHKDATFGKVEEDLLNHYTNLLKHKIQIEGLIDDNVSLDFVQLKKSYKQLSDEINTTQSHTIPSKEYLKQLNVATGLAAVDSLIQKVEAKISSRSTTLDKSQTKYMVSKLASESEELSKEITKLMVLLAETK